MEKGNRKVWKVQLKPFAMVKKGKKVYVAQVVNAKVVVDTQGIAEMIKEDGYELNKATILDVQQRINEKVVQVLETGNAVDLDIVKITPLVTGPWEDHDAYQEGIHTKSVNVTPKVKLLKALQNVIVDVTGYRKTGDSAIILGVVDKATKKKNYSITVNDNILIKGQYIRVQGYTEADEQDDTAEEGIGVFFVPEKGKPIQATRIDTNSGDLLEVRVPATLQKGKDYGLHIVTRYTGGRLLKVPRTIVADFLLHTNQDE